MSFILLVVIAIYACPFDLGTLPAERYVGPGGLGSFPPATQYSACGCVLGYHVPAPEWASVLVLVSPSRPEPWFMHSLLSADLPATAS